MVKTNILGTTSPIAYSGSLRVGGIKMRMKKIN